MIKSRFLWVPLNTYMSYMYSLWQPYLLDPLPHVYKSFLCQMRIHPYNIRLKEGALVLDRGSICHLCDWCHDLATSSGALSDHQIPEPQKTINLHSILKDSDLQPLFLSKPNPPFIWYLFKIAKSIITFSEWTLPFCQGSYAPSACNMCVTYMSYIILKNIKILGIY